MYVYFKPSTMDIYIYIHTICIIIIILNILIYINIYIYIYKHSIYIYKHLVYIDMHIQRIGVLYGSNFNMATTLKRAAQDRFNHVVPSSWILIIPKYIHILQGGAPQSNELPPSTNEIPPSTNPARLDRPCRYYVQLHQLQLAL